MMKTEQPMKSVVMVLTLLFFAGCVSFSRNQLTSVENLPSLPEKANKPTMGYSFASRLNLSTAHDDFENVRIQLENEFVDVLSESGYFASISPTNQGEIRIEVRLVNYGTIARIIPELITGLSLLTIPSWGTDIYNVTAEVITQDGKELTYELEDSVTTFNWLPLILVLPFQNPVTVPKQVRKNIWKHLIIKMESDGIL